MAGIDLPTATAKLQELLAAHSAVLKAQSFGQGDQNMVRAKLAAISADIDRWDRIVQRLTPASATESHGLSVFGDLKYPADFKHFDYVNPQAPKGGRVRFGLVGSFDNLNPYTFKGETGSAVINDTLLTSALDEPSTEYGLVASSVWHPEDRSMVVYRLRPEARFQDGTPMTPDDVIWSMQALRDANPFYNAYYKNIAKAEQTGEHEVTFTFTQKGNRELPLITGTAIGTLAELADLTLAADKVITF
jgi:ABC-type oligopeptide transport system substrate-binding subunit